MNVGSRCTASEVPLGSEPGTGAVGFPFGAGPAPSRVARPQQPRLVARDMGTPVGCSWAASLGFLGFQIMASSPKWGPKQGPGGCRLGRGRTAGTPAALCPNPAASERGKGRGKDHPVPTGELPASGIPSFPAARGAVAALGATPVPHCRARACPRPPPPTAATRGRALACPQRGELLARAAAAAKERSLGQVSAFCADGETFPSTLPRQG